MQYGSIVGIEKPVSRIGQGTVMLGPDREEEGFALLDAVFEGGVNLYDSSHIYGGGESERVFGRWVAARGIRDRVVLLTKGAHHDASGPRVRPECITGDLTGSLERLGFDFIDLYVLHRDDPTVPVGPIVEVLNEHHKAGRIGAFGGSNWTHDRIREANEYAAEHRLTPFAVSSPHFSLAEMVEPPWPNCVSIAGPRHEEAREWYAAAHTTLVPWSSLAGGFLSGRYTRESLEGAAEDDRAAANAKRCYGSEDNCRRLERLTETAAERGISVAQAAIAYVLSQPLSMFPLTAAWTPEEAHANAAAGEIRFSPAEVAWLDLQAETR